MTFSRLKDTLMNLRLAKFYCAIACSPLICFAVVLTGCDVPPPAAEKPKQESIIGKTTQDIGEYDPQGDAEIADLQVAADANPLEAAAGTYKFATGRMSEFGIDKALQFYNAEHGYYPKDYDTFMEQIVKKNKIHLPVLPGKRRYQYDVKNHKLVIVEAAAETEADAEGEMESDSQ